jgi:hypothetical protein
MTPHITRIHHRLDHWRRLFLAVVACASVGQLCTSLMSQSVTFSEYPLPKAMVAANTYGKLPLNFEPNQGQTDARVKVLARTFGYTLFVTADDAVFAGRDGPVERMKLMGANPKLRFESLDRQPGISNYFIGNDPSKWRTNIPNYGRVALREVYPGIDLVFYSNERQLEYDWVVSPGADPKHGFKQTRGVCVAEFVERRVRDFGGVRDFL